MDELWEILKDLTDVLEKALPLEEKKLQAIKENRLTALDDCMTKEQALMMKIRGLDKHREDVLRREGLEGVALREIIEKLPAEEQAEASKITEHFRQAVSDFQILNGEAMKLAKLYLHRIEEAKQSTQSAQSTYEKDNGKRQGYAGMTDRKV